MDLLVIDDDARFASSLVAALRLEGVDARSASTPSTIRRSVRRGGFDIALLDVWIPDLGVADEKGGQLVLTEIMTHAPRAKVILFSSMPSVEPVVECLKLGAVDFVSKPVGDEDHEDLVERLKARLKGPNLVHNNTVLRENLIKVLWENVAHGRPAERGSRLEELTYQLFASVAGFECTLNVTKGPYEIDVLVRNERPEPFWIRRGDEILVQCKNLGGRQRAPRDTLDVMMGTIARTHGRCKLAFFFSPTGFSSKFMHAVQTRRQAGVELVCVNRLALDNLVRCGSSLRPGELQKLVLNSAA